MTFQINGTNGKYDNIVNDKSVRYGRNAVENNIQYMESPLVNDKHDFPPILKFVPSEKNDEENFAKLDEFIKSNDEYLNSLPPLEFEYRYMPNIQNGNIDKKALYGAAYEEMGQNKELSLKEFEARFLPNKEFTAEPLDINKDGNIDVSEYGANILASDVLSKGTDDISKVDGTINSKGLNAILDYTKKANSVAATNLYSQIYKTYDLGSQLNEFTP